MESSWEHVQERINLLKEMNKTVKHKSSDSDNDSMDNGIDSKFMTLMLAPSSQIMTYMAAPSSHMAAPSSHMAAPSSHRNIERVMMTNMVAPSSQRCDDGVCDLKPLPKELMQQKQPMREHIYPPQEQIIWSGYNNQVSARKDLA